MGTRYTSVTMKTLVDGLDPETRKPHDYRFSNGREFFQPHYADAGYGVGNLLLEGGGHLLLEGVTGLGVLVLEG